MDGAAGTTVTVRRVYAVANAGNQIKIRGNATDRELGHGRQLRLLQRQVLHAGRRPVPRLRATPLSLILGRQRHVRPSATTPSPAKATA